MSNTTIAPDASGPTTPNASGGVTPGPGCPEVHVDKATGLTKALSPRMAEVLGYADGGMTNADIAVRLGIDPGTVSNAKVAGLHRAGRTAEVPVTSGTGRKAGKALVGMRATVAATLTSYVDAIKAALSGEAEATAEAAEVGGEAWAKATAEALRVKVTEAEAAVVKAQDAVTAFEADPAPRIAEDKAKAEAKAKAARDHAVTEVPTLVPEAREALAYLGQDAPEDAEAVVLGAEAFVEANPAPTPEAPKAEATPEAEAPEAPEAEAPAKATRGGRRGR